MNQDELNNLTVTDEDIAKAMENLNIGEESASEEVISKAVEEDENETKIGTNAKMEGGEKEEEEEEVEKSYEYREMEKGCGEYQKFEKGGDKPVDAKKYMQDANGDFAEITKKADSEEGEDAISKAEEEEAFEKALDANPVLDRFHKSMLSMEDSIDEKFASVGTLLKGIMDENKALRGELEDVKNTPLAPKSVTTAPVDRFNKGEEQGKLGDNVLSVSQNKKQVLDLMEKAAFEGEGNDTLLKGILAFEQSNSISPVVQQEFEKATNMKLVK